MFCKTIILSNSENITNNAPKGILTLSNTNNKISGKIRLYNITSLPLNTKLGIYCNNNVQIVELNKKPQHYEFSISNPINLNDSIYCALIDNNLGDKKVILEGGSFNGFYFSDSPFDAVLEAKDEELEQVIDNAMKESSCCEDCSNCANCEYKNYFYSNYQESIIEDDMPQDKILDNDSMVNNTEDKILENNNINVEDNNIKDTNIEDNNIENNISVEINSTTDSNEENTEIRNENPSQNEDSSLTEEQSTFLNDIIYQLDEMFAKYPADDILNSIIPDSKFIKVENENSNPYVLGVIYEDKLMKYIAYGVPAKYNSLPPNDFGQNYQWLPLNPNDVMSDGYFLIYQNALNGKIVQLTIE